MRVSRSFTLANVPIWLTGKKRIIQCQLKKDPWRSLLPGWLGGQRPALNWQVKMALVMTVYVWEIRSCPRLSELWQGRCSSARLAGSGALSSLLPSEQPSEAPWLICRWINFEPQSRVQWFEWHIVGEAKILQFPITWPCWVFTDDEGSLQKYSDKFKANEEKQNSFCWIFCHHYDENMLLSPCVC